MYLKRLLNFHCGSYRKLGLGIKSSQIFVQFIWTKNPNLLVELVFIKLLQYNYTIATT